MSIADPISALAAQSSSVTASKPRNQLDQNSFLQLMIAQFRNQDPTKPKDPSEFLSQLAQFSTVSGIQEMQSSLSTLSESLRSSQALDGAGLVGRQVLAPTDSVRYSGSGMVTGALDVPDGAMSIEFNVKDAAGQLIRRVTLPAASVAGGTMEFAWDGLSERGTPVAAGQYRLSAIANVGGKGESLPVLLASRVDSVTIDPTSHQLTLNTATLGSIALSNVRRMM
jgi:flagellar basal-body rod modification protein FlgD